MPATTIDPVFRSDIHRLYDRGQVNVTERDRLWVSWKLGERLFSGEPDYPLGLREILALANAAGRRDGQPDRYDAGAAFCRRGQAQAGLLRQARRGKAG